MVLRGSSMVLYNFLMVLYGSRMVLHDFLMVLYDFRMVLRGSSTVLYDSQLYYSEDIDHFFAAVKLEVKFYPKKDLQIG